MKQGWAQRWVGLALLAALNWPVPASAQTGGTRTGGTTGSSFSGGFSGGTGTTGGSFSGTTGGSFSGTTGTFGGTTTTGGTTRTGTTGTTGGVSTVNPFRTYYITPQSAGLLSIPLPQTGTSGLGSAATAGQGGAGTSGNGSNTTIRGITSTKAFGQPLLYATTTTGGTSFGGTATTIGGSFGGAQGTGTTGITGGTGVTGGTGISGGYGFTTIGQIRAPAYSTELGDTVNVRTIPPAAIQSDVQAVLQRSSTLRAPGNINITMEGPVVVLRGTVATDRERRLAEGLVRLTRGVRDVRNELVIRP